MEVLFEPACQELLWQLHQLLSQPLHGVDAKQQQSLTQLNLLPKEVMEGQYLDKFHRNFVSLKPL